MRMRQVVMALALSVSAGLAFWADKTPEQDSLLADTVHRAGVSSTSCGRPKPGGRATGRARWSCARPGRLRLRERDTLVRIGEDDLAELDVFAARSWDPPPPRLARHRRPRHRVFPTPTWERSWRRGSGRSTLRWVRTFELCVPT